MPTQRQLSRWIKLNFACILLAACQLSRPSTKGRRHYFNSFIFCLGFGERETFKMVLSWIIAYGWTFAFIEPVQVCLLACCPCLWDEETRCGRCMNWVRFIYNELLSP